ncbi:hypothetical protein ACNIUU_26805, partial [Escherichia coli]
GGETALGGKYARRPTQKPNTTQKAKQRTARPPHRKSIRGAKKKKQKPPQSTKKKKKQQKKTYI